MGNDEAGFSGGSWGQVLRFIISEIGCWKPFAGKCVIARLDPKTPSNGSEKFDEFIT